MLAVTTSGSGTLPQVGIGMANQRTFLPSRILWRRSCAVTVKRRRAARREARAARHDLAVEHLRQRTAGHSRARSVSPVSSLNSALSSQRSCSLASTTSTSSSPS